MSKNSDGTKIYIPPSEKKSVVSGWEKAPTKIYKIKKNG